LPSNLFSVALLAYLQSSHSLKAFIGSFYQVIAVPMGYAPRMAGNRIREEMRKLSGSHSSSHRNMTDEDSTELDFWLRQMPLLRIWARHGPRSFHMACSTWRERTFQSAAVTTWDALQEGLVRATRQPEDSWIAIDWSPIEERRDRRLNDDTQQSSASHDQQTLWRDRPKLPLRFTPDIAADFLRTFLHIDLPDRAESAWLFLESHNMTPSLVMWNALLTGHLHRKDLEAAEAVYQEMEKTKDAKIWSHAQYSSPLTSTLGE
jgi:pentatricopeptide repeat protein